MDAGCIGGLVAGIVFWVFAQGSARGSGTTIEVGVALCCVIPLGLFASSC